MTDQQLNALKRAACEWVLAEHPYLGDNTKTDADWAAWFDAVQEGKIDFDEPAIGEEGNETGYRVVYLIEDYEGWQYAIRYRKLSSPFRFSCNAPPLQPQYQRQVREALC